MLPFCRLSPHLQTSFVGACIGGDGKGERVQHMFKNSYSRLSVVSWCCVVLCTNSCLSQMELIALSLTTGGMDFRISVSLAGWLTLQCGS